MKHIVTALSLTGILATSVMSAAEETPKRPVPTINANSFRQEVATFYGTKDGLPSDNIRSMAVSTTNEVFAGTEKGLFRLSDDTWIQNPEIGNEPVEFIAAAPTGGVFCIAKNDIYRVASTEAAHFADLPDGATPRYITIAKDRVFVSSESKILEYSIENGELLESIERKAEAPSSMAADADGNLVVTTAGGLISFGPKDNEGTQLEIRDAKQNWAALDIRDIIFDSKGRLWFANPHGVGCRDANDAWTLYTGTEGLPYNQFTCAAKGVDGTVWFGTTKGAIWFDGKHWAYRQGRRWLPNDDVRDIAVDSEGNAYIATPSGVALIERSPMTFKEKAKYYEDEIDRRHRRTDYEYIAEVKLKHAGDKDSYKQEDTDNDGLWTSMYGAGECFAYAATKDSKAKARAKSAFEALRFLQVVTQGGTPPALPGFIARTILPTDGPDPNQILYTPEQDRLKQKAEPQWKIMSPRWPVSADGKWYWKSDTSSDELDGHYFFYGLYYDLVADTDEEKARVRDVVVNLTDHLIDHDFCLVDWDGRPTRWAIFSPSHLNNDPLWIAERGLNSLSILSYLAVAHHVTGDAKYVEAFDSLVKNHGYAMNLMHPKEQYGPGSNNQSDDEMAFMSFYNLIRYSHDDMVRDMALFSFNAYWTLEQPELNPFFNFTYAAVSYETNSTKATDLAPKGEWLEQSLETLERFPLDRISWKHTNSHRIDIIPLPAHSRPGHEAKGKGHRTNGLALPVDESYFTHWNTDIWELDTGGIGRELGDGAVYLLPYYMGLYHGFLQE